MATSFAVSRPAAPQPPRAAGGIRSTRRAACKCRFRLLRLAAQTLRPAASRQRLLRRPAHRRGRRRPRRVDDLSLRHRHLRPRRHRGLRIDVGADRLGAAAARDDRDPDAHDGTVFAYWHIVPAVHNGEYAVAYRTVLGHISKGWEHVHLAELVDGRYVNPLRRGAITPYADTTRPTVHAFSFERNGKAIGRTRARRAVRSCCRGRGRDPGGRARALGRQARHARARPVAARADEGLGVRMANRDRLLAHHPGAGSVRSRLRTVDAPEPCVASWPLSAQSRAGLGQSTLSDGRQSLDVASIDTRGNRGRSSTVFSIAN